jgi:hypothetical protein
MVLFQLSKKWLNKVNCKLEAKVLEIGISLKINFCLRQQQEQVLTGYIK